jgi:hypothetical protein
MLRDTPPGEDGVDKSASLKAQEAITAGYAKEGDGAANNEDPHGFLAIVSKVETMQTLAQMATVRANWAKAMRAYNNQHANGSKYLSPKFKERSKFFRPKTRSAVKKDKAAIAQSLFGTSDAITTSPGNEADPIQRASAALIKELLNYRTDRTSSRHATPWFHAVMGARHNSLLTNICVSKQFWRREVRFAGMEKQAMLDDAGAPMLDEFSQPMREDVRVLEYTMNRPECVVLPPENVTLDLAADWTNPAQESDFLRVMWPMRRSAIKRMMKAPLNPWKEYDDAALNRARGKDSAEQQTIRQAREGGTDRFAAEAGNSGEFDIIWVTEFYIRDEHDDYTFFSLGGNCYLTDPKPVREVYPEQGGDRPIRIGIADLDPHRIYSMSPVESWLPMQGEINDVVNLRLDAIKQAITPAAFVRRGKRVDVEAVQRRGQHSVIYVDDVENDVKWDKPPGVGSEAFAEMDRLNVDFDDAAGQFNGASVQTNRSLNETVGGMKLLAGSANVVQEYDQRVFVETWVEPVLMQLARLIQYYEDDPIILGICGEKAQLLQKHGISEITDQLLDQEVTLRVNVGVGGSSDPELQIKKFANASAIMKPVLEVSPEFQSGAITIDVMAVADEVFGKAGYRDGGKRFFKKGEPQGPDPKMQAEVEKLQAQVKDLLAAAEKKAAETVKTQVDTKLAAVEAAHSMVSGERDREENREQRGFDNKITAHKLAADHVNREADRSDRREERALEGGAKPQPQGPGEMPAGLPDRLKAAIQKKAGEKGKKVEFIFGPDGRISGADVTEPDGTKRRVVLQKNDQGVPVGATYQ